MRRGEPLTDADRWPWLDRLGAAIGAAARAEDVAVAACSALKRIYRDRISHAIGVPTTFILLEAGREELERRLTSRPGHYMPASLLDSQFSVLDQGVAAMKTALGDAWRHTAVLTITEFGRTVTVNGTTSNKVQLPVQ